MLRHTLVVDANTGMATAGTADSVYACHGQPGEWEIDAAYFAPDDSRTLDASHYATLSIKQGSDTIGSFTTAAVGLTEGTPRAFDVTSGGTPRRFGAGDGIVCGKAVTGNGVAITGRWCIAFRKVQADTIPTFPTS